MTMISQFSTRSVFHLVRVRKQPPLAFRDERELPTIHGEDMEVDWDEVSLLGRIERDGSIGTETIVQEWD
jgi:hypothetical protein